MTTFPIGMQPWTIRNELNEDYVDSLEKVARIGYRGIELGLPPEGMSIEEQKAHLERLGLQVIGTHGWGYEIDLEVLADYLAKVGGRYLTISGPSFASREEILEVAGKLNRLGRLCKEHGFQFLYHNHDWEFEKFDGEIALDILAEATDPGNVKFELDTYWVAKGGEDPAAYIRKFAGRCPILHLKDMEAGEEAFFAEIGEGVLDFHAIAEAAEAVGVEWMIVEQDETRRTPFESLEISYRNLMKMDFSQKS